MDARLPAASWLAPRPAVRSAIFAKSPIGVAFDLDVPVARFRSGANIKELVLVEC
jgi:hypothetical protein